MAPRHHPKHPYRPAAPAAPARWLVHATAFWEREGRVEGPAFSAVYHVREVGRLVPPFPLGGWSLPPDDPTGSGFSSALHPALLAISFMHCKNVARETVTPAEQLNRARERRGRVPLLRYETLVIDPMKTVLRREGKSDAVGLRRALHICRGHFADYTAGAGLFGKHHGAFWVDAHVRGERRAGQIEKEYEVLPRREPER